MKLDYKIGDEFFRKRKSVYYEAIQTKYNRKVFIQTIKESESLHEDLVGLKNDFELTFDTSIQGTLKALNLIKYSPGIALVKEHFDGVAIDDYIAGQRISLVNKIEIAISLLKIVLNVHASSIIHKDLTLHSFLINISSGNIKLTDFELATRLTKETSVVGPMDSLKGSIPHMSPEQTGRMNRSIDYRSDFYTLGVSLYQLFCNRLPFTSHSTLELVYSHIARKPVAPSEIDKSIPHSISDILLKMLEKNPEDRYKSAQGIISDFERCLKSWNKWGTVDHFSLGQNDIFTSFTISEKLYGREEETIELLKLFDQIKEGPIQLALVSGYSGIGKTRLVQEIHKPIASSNGYFVAGKFDQYMKNIPYTAISQAIGALVKQKLAEDEIAISQWKTELLEVLGNEAQELSELIPELELLIGRQEGAYKLPAKESQNRILNLFAKLFKVIATRENPLVLFVDDIHWADSGSIELIKYLIYHGDLRYLLFIGAFRDNEVGPLHPLSLLIEQLHKKDKILSIWKLEELSKTDINRFIADSLHQDPLTTFELTELITSKTAGNPFFVNQIFEKLIDGQNIYFDHSELEWRWDAKSIDNLDITENVVDLLISKIKSLPQESQEILKLASCIGNKFEFDTLLINNKSNEISKALWHAVEEELLIPLGYWSKHHIDQMWSEMGIEHPDNHDIAFQFSHDKVQQASYALLTNDDKETKHLEIGRMMKKNLSETQGEHVFDVVQHFNIAHKLLTDKHEKQEIAKLNLQAADSAKRSNSNQPALSFYKAGMKLLDAREEGQLFQELLLGRSETEYLSGNYMESERLYDQAIKKAKDNYSKANIFSHKMKLYENTSRYPEAISAALRGLKLLGVRLPERPGQIRIMQELLLVKSRLLRKSIDDLKKHKKLKSKSLQLVMQLLNNLWGPAYLNNQNLLALAILKMVNISLKYGNSDESSTAYAFYGFVCCAQLNQIKVGYKYAELGMWLVDNNDTRRLVPRVYVIFAGCVMHWKDHFDSSLSILNDAHQIGKEVNDLIYAGYALNFISNHSYYMGVPLPIMYEKLKKFIHFARQIRHQATIHDLLARARTICQFLCVDIDPTLFDDSADIEIHLLQITKLAEREKLTLVYTNHHIYQAEWFYHQDEYEKAVLNLDKAEKHIVSILGLAHSGTFNFYQSLSLLALALKNPKEWKKKALRKVRKNQKQLLLWANNASENWRSKYNLVEAEKATLLGQTEQSMNFYKIANEEAKKNKIIQDEGLISERAALFYLSNGFSDLGQSLLTHAFNKYREWGAEAMLVKLSHLLENFQINDGFVDSTIFKQYAGVTSLANQIDLESIFKASTSISKEVVFEKLLERLLNILLENAGARNGYIIINHNSMFFAVAKGSVEDEKNVQLLDNVPVEKLDDLPQSIIRYVKNTLEEVVLYDPVTDDRFSKDQYLISREPKSVLCQPIMHSNKCIAIIYLENELTKNAFTKERLKVLKLLSGQMAVSIENASLYNNQILLNDAYQRFVPKDFIKALGHESILDANLGDSIDEEMTVLFCDIRSYTALSEGMNAKENFELINSYHKIVGPIIRNHGGFINHYLGDGFIALFKDNPLDAIESAIDMQNQLSEYNKRKAKGDNKKIVVGMGMHTGPVMMGIIGDLGRHDANVLSDAVNVSARLESLTKIFNSNILVSGSTYEKATEKDNFQNRYLGKVRVKGKNEVLDLYEIFDMVNKIDTENKNSTVDHFNKGLAAYFDKNFTEAASRFKKVLEINKDDNASKRYLKNAANFIVNDPPADWDGVEQMY